MRTNVNEPAHLGVLVTIAVVLLASVPGAPGAVATGERFRLPTEEELAYHDSYFKKYGIPADTIEDNLAGAKSDSYYVRMASLEYLTVRLGKEAKLMLGVALSDPAPRVRARAAELLAALGDDTGLEVLRRDFEALTKAIDLNDYAEAGPSPYGPGMGTQAMDLLDALEVARVLVLFGDHRGFELVAKTAIEGRGSYARGRALRALGLMNKYPDRDGKGDGNRDPVLIFETLIDSEVDPNCMYQLTQVVAAHTQGAAKKRLLDKIVRSPNATEPIRRKAMACLEAELRREVEEVERRQRESKE